VIFMFIVPCPGIWVSEVALFLVMVNDQVQKLCT